MKSVREKLGSKDYVVCWTQRKLRLMVAAVKQDKIIVSPEDEVVIAFDHIDPWSARDNIREEIRRRQ
jgi:hypothetical protein